jgi:hypothetical protein
MNEPQTPRTDAQAFVIIGTTGRYCWASFAEMLERDLASANQRIAELHESNCILQSQIDNHDATLAQQRICLDQRITTLEAANATLLARLNQRVADFDATDRQRLERIGELEGALDKIWNILECGMSKVAWRDIALVVNTALTPSPPAVEKEERWSREREAHKAGRRIQFRYPRPDKTWCEWTPCSILPTWASDCEYRIHPDDAPPETEGIEHGQTYEEFVEGKLHAERFLHEEKPATVPLAVAERLAEALETALEYFEDREDADHNGRSFVPNTEMTQAESIRQSLAAFKASTQQQ